MVSDEKKECVGEPPSEDLIVGLDHDTTVLDVGTDLDAYLSD